MGVVRSLLGEFRGIDDLIELRAVRSLFGEVCRGILIELRAVRSLLGEF